MFISVWPRSPQTKHIRNLKKWLKSFNCVMFKMRRINAIQSWYGCSNEQGSLGELPKTKLLRVTKPKDSKYKPYFLTPSKFNMFLKNYTQNNSLMYRRHSFSVWMRQIIPINQIISKHALDTIHNQKSRHKLLLSELTVWTPTGLQSQHSNEE